MENTAMKNAILNRGRRNFLRTASVAAAAGLTLGDSKLFAAPAEGQGAVAAPSAEIQLFTAEKLQADITAMKAVPGGLLKRNPMTSLRRSMRSAEHRRARTVPVRESGLRRVRRVRRRTCSRRAIC